jgi:ribose transport system ATP-binding protein
VSETPVLALTHVSRSFGPVEVLHDVSFALHPGRVHALIGENGAGKSTMMKILSGFLEPTQGTVDLDGQPVAFPSAKQAEDAGIILIHQEFNLAEALSVEENIFLGREVRKGFRLLDRVAMEAEARRQLDRLGTKVDVRSRVRDLAVSDKQMVEIAKALSRKVRVLIMDEPTAVLTNREASVLFDQIDRLKAEGVAILYTSHKLDEIGRVADDLTVLRDGTVVSQGLAADYDEDRMAREMVGRDLTSLFPATHDAETAATVLEVAGLNVPGQVHDLSFELKAGEVLGFAGLVGSGRTEAMEGLMGLRPATASVKVNGKVVTIRTMADATAAGLGYLTEDRKGRGLILNQGLTANLTLLALKKL